MLEVLLLMETLLLLLLVLVVVLLARSFPFPSFAPRIVAPTPSTLPAAAAAADEEAAAAAAVAAVAAEGGCGLHRGGHDLPTAAEDMVSDANGAESPPAPPPR